MNNVIPIILHNQDGLVPIKVLHTQCGDFPVVVKHNAEHIAEVIYEKRKRALIRSANERLWVAA